MTRWLTCNDGISENCVEIECHSLAYISNNSALKSSEVTDRKLLVNDPIKHVRDCSIFKMTSSLLRMKPPHDPKGCILVLVRTPLKINILTNYNKLQGDFTFSVVKLFYNENIARKQTAQNSRIEGQKKNLKYFILLCCDKPKKKIFLVKITRIVQPTVFFFFCKTLT